MIWPIQSSGFQVKVIQLFILKTQSFMRPPHKVTREHNNANKFDSNFLELTCLTNKREKLFENFIYFLLCFLLKLLFKKIKKTNS